MRKSKSLTVKVTVPTWVSIRFGAQGIYFLFCLTSTNRRRRKIRYVTESKPSAEWRGTVYQNAVGGDPRGDLSVTVNQKGFSTRRPSQSSGHGDYWLLATLASKTLRTCAGTELWGLLTRRKEGTNRDRP